MFLRGRVWKRTPSKLLQDVNSSLPHFCTALRRVMIPNTNKCESELLDFIAAEHFMSLYDCYKRRPPFAIVPGAERSRAHPSMPAGRYGEIWWLFELMEIAISNQFVIFTPRRTTTFLQSQTTPVYNINPMFSDCTFRDKSVFLEAKNNNKERSGTTYSTVPTLQSQVSPPEKA